ncbi:hypothetical protein J6X04_01170 [Candidatus Saccharibacteria bacterium]|nr:hypothetical protein [Candidatus Saccharibacteria bacterium]
MLDNLALDPTNSTTASNMDETNTNASAIDIANLLNGGSNITGHSNVAVTNVTSGFNSYTEPMINNTNKDTLVIGFGPASNNNQSKIGVYYNYCAATVGTYCYARGSGANELVPQDLCPAGWRMPTYYYNNYSEYYLLGVSLNISYYGVDGVFYGDKVMDYAESLNTTLSGLYLNNSVSYQDSSGYWWSSLANSYFACASRASYYGPRSLEIYDSLGEDRSAGIAMRCVAGQATGN